MDENTNTQNNKRPTHTFITSGGHKVVLKDWITGREEDDIQKVYLEKMEMKQTMQGGKKGTENVQQEMTGLTGSAHLEAERKTVELVVVSVDGSEENVVDRLLDMRSKDRNEVRDEIERITGGDDTGAKKKQ